MRCRVLVLMLVMSVVPLVQGQFTSLNNYSHKKFYIYDPLDITNEKNSLWGFPQCATFDSFAENAGFGHELDPDGGLHDSWHHSLFSSLFGRLRFSSRRTFHPSEAELFFIPYDTSLLERFTTFNETNRTCNDRSLRLCPSFNSDITSFLRLQPTFHKHSGIDHVVLGSMTSPFDTCARLLSKVCPDCLGTGYFTNPPLKEITRSTAAIWQLKTSGFVSLPFPSVFHWHEELRESPPWTTNPPRPRPLLSSFVGSQSMMFQPHSKVRKVIVHACQGVRNVSLCTFLQPTWVKHTPNLKVMRSQLINIDRNDDFIRDMMHTYKQSVFCFVPPGDEIPRRGLFDVLLAGCIPVMVHPLMLHAQYPFHLGEERAKAVSVFVPMRLLDSFSSKFKIISFLKNIPTSIIREKQRQIELLAPSLQYSRPPLHLLKEPWPQKREQVGPQWDPPFRDAVDVALDGMFSRAEKLIRGEAVALPEFPDRTAAAWMRMYNTTLK